MAGQRALSLHHLSLMELTPIDLVRVAGEAEFEHVCIFVQDMPGLPFPLVTPEMAPGFGKALKETGVSVYNLEIFPLSSEIGPQAYRQSLAFGAELGGTRATALIADDDASDGQATDWFGRFCEIAGEYGIESGLEFMAFSSVKTLDHAMRIVRGAGRENGTLALDFLHLMRNGTGPADLDRLKVSGDEIGYVQFCDGPMELAADDAFDEATRNRTPPGEGDFPLREILMHVPAGSALSVECPVERMAEKGVSALDRAKLLATAARSTLALLES